MDNYELLRFAIRRRKIVSALYQGRRRVMCPHVLGEKNGRRQALLYQFAGEHERELAPSGSPANWRCLLVENLEQIELLDGPWHSSQETLQSQVCIDQVAAAVEEFDLSAFERRASV